MLCLVQQLETWLTTGSPQSFVVQKSPWQIDWLIVYPPSVRDFGLLPLLGILQRILSVWYPQYVWMEFKKYLSLGISECPGQSEGRVYPPSNLSEACHRSNQERWASSRFKVLKYFDKCKALWLLSFCDLLPPPELSSGNLCKSKVVEGSYC